MKPKSVKFIESKGKFGMVLGLDNIRRLLIKLKNPQNKLKFIHVAGSNGKGSISRLLEAGLLNNNYKIGMFTSPSLEKFNERIRVNGVDIPDDDLQRLFEKVKNKCDEIETEGFPYPTGYEIETAIALLYFLEQNCDLVIMEVGLGGRLDATNIIRNTLIEVISSISLEHTKYLGDTLEQIAKEKAAIIKDNSHVVISPQMENTEEVIINEANKRYIKSITKLKEDQINTIKNDLNARIFNVLGDNYSINLLGTYQKNNFLTALATFNLLNDIGFPINKDNLKNAFKTISFPGRFEILSNDPYIIIDGAHNPDGIKKCVESIKQYFPDKKVTLIFGMLEEKDITKSLKELLTIAKEIYLLEPDNPEKLENEEVKRIIRTLDKNVKVISLANIEELKKVIKRDDKNQIYLITGSLYLIGKVRTMFKHYLNQV